MSVRRWPIAGCDGPMEASTIRSSGELAMSRFARPRSAPSSSLRPSNSAWSAATTNSSPAPSSSVRSGLRVRWPLLLTASSRTPERCNAPISSRLRPTQKQAALIRMRVRYRSSNGRPPDRSIGPSLVGKSHRPRISKVPIPAPAAMRPTPVSSNIPNGSTPARCATPSTIRLVELPSRVSEPPMIER